MKFTLKALRVNQNLNLKKASKLIGVSLSTLWSWENKKTTPHTKYIPIIENLYNCKYDDILW